MTDSKAELHLAQVCHSGTEQSRGNMHARLPFLALVENIRAEGALMSYALLLNQSARSDHSVGRPVDCRRSDRMMRREFIMPVRAVVRFGRE